MKRPKNVWSVWLKIGVAIGNVISAIFLLVFYYTIFALFAIPVRIFSRPLGKKFENSNWINKKLTLTKLEDFKSE